MPNTRRLWPMDNGKDASQSRVTNRDFISPIGLCGRRLVRLFVDTRGADGKRSLNDRAGPVFPSIGRDLGRLWLRPSIQDRWPLSPFQLSGSLDSRGSPQRRRRVRVPTRWQDQYDARAGIKAGLHGCRHRLRDRKNRRPLLSHRPPSYT